MTKLVIIEMPEYASRDLTIERSILGAGVDIEHVACDGEEGALVEACRGADVVLTDFVPFTRAALKQLPTLRLISVAATGYSNIDVAAARDFGIRVCAIDEYCTDEVADHAIMLMLALGRRLIDYHEQVQAEYLWKFDSLSGLPRFSDVTLGVIGYGRIGRAVARRAAAFGMHIMPHDPYIGDALYTLDEVLAGADIITLHCNLSSESRHMLDRSAFEKMKKSPMLINVARGGLIVEPDLVWALDAGLVSAAGLDVLEQEAPDLRQSPLVGRPDVVLTPHVAFYSDASILDNRNFSVENIRHYLDGNHDAVRRYVAGPPSGGAA